MNRILLSLGVCLSLLLTVACNKSDDESYSENNFPACFAYVTDVAGSVSAAYSSVSYQARIYFGSNKAEVKINGMKLPDGTNYPAMTLKDLSWSVNDKGWIVVKAADGADITPELANYGKVPTIKYFELRMLSRYVENIPMGCMTAVYNIDGTYNVTSSIATQVVGGTTVSTNEADGSRYQTTLTSYAVSFNFEKGIMDILMKNSRFLEAMPSGFNIMLKSVPFTLIGTTASWHIDAITPEIGGTPYPNYPITDVRGTFDFNEGLNLNFICEPRGMGRFSVSANCSLLDPA